MRVAARVATGLSSEMVHLCGPPSLRRSSSLLRACLLCIPLVLGLSSCAQRTLPPAPQVTDRLVLDTADLRDLSDAHAYADSLEQLASRAGSPTVLPRSLIAIGYLERLRLGLGSPFRLIEHALDDRRLDPDERVDLGWALLARTHAGRSYRVDPSALDWIGGGGNPSWRWIGDDHLGLIDSVVSTAADPWAAEALLRFAYRAAVAEGLVGERTPDIVAGAAALLGDRALAMRDARALLGTARDTGISALALIGEWRKARRFRVEQPALTRLARDPPVRLLLELPQLVERIRGIARPGVVSSPFVERLRLAARPLLDAAGARRLSALARRYDAPPEAAIVATLATSRDFVLDRPGDGRRAERLRFLRAARNEELFAAEHAAAVANDARSHPGLALASLRSIVALRTHAQEDAWMPGDGGPTAHALRTRYGFKSVSFDADVPTRWRPYYLRMIDHAAADMLRVLPDLQLDGLGIHFGASPLGEGTLASHSARTRTIFIPPATGSGTIAHELAHDLDWYAIRRGQYATDEAIRREQRQLAALLGRLSETRELGSPEQPGQPSYASRPTEVFARSVDWFVAAALAQRGRMSGYLSTVQDELLTGYTLVPAPDRAGQAGSAVVELLSRMTTVPAGVERAFLSAYGAGRARTLLEDADVVLRQQGPASPREWRAVRAARSLTSIACAGAAEPGDSLDLARERVLTAAAIANARSIVRRWAATRPDPSDPPAVQALRGIPWSEERVAGTLDALASDILTRAFAGRTISSGAFPGCVSLLGLAGRE